MNGKISCINMFTLPSGEKVAVHRRYLGSNKIYVATMQSILFALSASTLVFAAPAFEKRADIKCPIVFDGRVPTSFAANPTLFDSNTTNNIFNPDFVKGNNLKFSNILKFPNVTKSRFDSADTVAVEPTISDDSIFNTQQGFRRVGLQFAKDAPDGPGQTGIKTLHFSVMQDPARPLNLSHEYLVSSYFSRDILKVANNA